MPQRLLLAWLVLGAAGCTAADHSVTRVVDGREIRGRAIPPQAYAAYARGAYLEAHGRPAEAKVAYQRALRADPRGVLPHVRLGALLCADDERAADRHFSAAAEVDSSYEPLWRARASCHLAHGRLVAAHRAAARAFALDPLRTDTALLLANVLERRGLVDEARRHLDALVIGFPTSSVAWRALRDFARRRADPTTEERAELALLRLGGRALAGPSERASDVRRTRQDLDGALLRSELRLARGLAREAQVSAGELSVRAAALGCVDLAREQSALVLRADSNDSDAWIAALFVADLERNTETFETAVSALGWEPVAPSPLAVRLMAELLNRRLGPSAAQAWLQAHAPLPAPADALEEAVAARLGQ